MILSRFAFTDVDARLIWAGDAFHVARGVLRVQLLLDDKTPVQAFAVHLPALGSASQARADWMKVFKGWAATFPGARIVGGDFNERPTAPAVASIAGDYVDAFASAGAGSGFTHGNDSGSFDSRIDYLFSSGVKVTNAFVPQVALSDHRPVVADYLVASRPTVVVSPPTPTQPATPAVPAPDRSGEIVFLEDDFEEARIDVAKWPGGVFSGNTHDDAVAVAAADGTLAIGPLKATGGWHYNAISSGTYSMAGNAYAQAQLVQGSVGADAYAMFTAGSDGANFYRFYQGGPADRSTISAEKKVAGTKSLLARMPFVTGDQLYLRIRHDSRPDVDIDDVVFETSTVRSFETNVELYRERWNPAVVASAISFELKAGTSGFDANETVVRWDRFSAGTLDGANKP
jgi:hypothetical protein